jgi:aryl-phospho-beta-D-glucosidase BglC (GH1 family)
MRMATKYGASPNVIFEIWNEPLGVSWESVKAYAHAQGSVSDEPRVALWSCNHAERH